MKIIYLNLYNNSFHFKKAVFRALLTCNFEMISYSNKKHSNWLNYWSVNQVNISRQTF